MTILTSGCSAIPAEDPRTPLIDSWLTSWSERTEFSGVVLIADHGEVIYKRAFGFADYQHGIPNTINTRFDVGSVAKPFLAAVTLRLVEEGKLDLQRPISTYLNEMSSTPAKDVTIHELLTHTGGLPDHHDVENYFDRIMEPITRREILSMFKDRPLLFNSGTQHRYSNFGYTAVALAC